MADTVIHAEDPEDVGWVITYLAPRELQFRSGNTNFRVLCSSIELKDNTVIVVLGASGDLAKKKTVGAC